jgi:hypothetical protein
MLTDRVGYWRFDNSLAVAGHFSTRQSVEFLFVTTRFTSGIKLNSH